jgi:hypothetical protein
MMDARDGIGHCAVFAPMASGAFAGIGDGY